MPQMMVAILSTSDVARVLSGPEYKAPGGRMDEWRIRRLFETGDLAEAPKFCGRRIIFADRLPEIVAALRRRGWLPVEAPEGKQS